MRGITWISTGRWEIPNEPCRPTLNLYACADWPGLTTKPITDETWKVVRGIFFQSFEKALRTGTYPRKLVVKDLTESAVNSAFDSSVTLQIKLQQQKWSDGRALQDEITMQTFAGRAAVSGFALLTHLRNSSSQKWLMACYAANDDAFWKESGVREEDMPNRKKSVLRILVNLRADGMSSDEHRVVANDSVKTVVYVRRTHAWRSAALQTLLKDIRVWLQRKKYITLPYIESQTESTRPAPTGLPKGCYSTEWLTGLTPQQRRDLQMAG